LDELVEYGEVISVNEKECLVEINKAAACGSCALKGSCSVESGKIVLRVPRRGMEIHKGEFVELRIPKSRATKAAFVIYGVPMITFIGLLLLGKLFALSDISALLLATGGLAADFVLIHFYDRKKGKEFSPRIARVLRTER